MHLSKWGFELIHVLSLPLSFCPVGRSAPDASPHVALSPPMFYQAGTVWPLSCRLVAHCALSRPVNQTGKVN